MKIHYLSRENFKNKRVLLRVDFNVPLDDSGRITNDERIKRTLPTIKKLLEDENKLIIVSHLGRPKGRDPKLSLTPVAKRLAEYLPNYEVSLIDNFLTEPEIFNNQHNRQILLLENIRFYPEEKNSEPAFVKALVGLADVYVNEAFAVCHRSGASIDAVAKLLPSYAGLLLQDEIEALNKVVVNPERPLLTIIAGSKISTKIALIESLLKLADYLVVGGALANPLLKARGLEIGLGFMEEGQDNEAARILKLAEDSNCRLVLPVDRLGKKTDGRILFQDVDKLDADLETFDIGPKTIKLISELVTKSKTIMWNGPVGMFEDERFAVGTRAVFEAIIASDATSIIGGGDTIAAIANLPGAEKITHISTGGGAMLEYIEKGTLPGVEALKR